MIQFAAFSLRQTRTVTREKLSFFGKPTGNYEVVQSPAYKDTHELYAVVAAFASTVKVVAITGSAWGEDAVRYLAGDIVVWYKEKKNAVSDDDTVRIE